MLTLESRHLITAQRRNYQRSFVEKPNHDDIATMAALTTAAHHHWPQHRGRFMAHVRERPRPLNRAPFLYILYTYRETTRAERSGDRTGVEKPTRVKKH